MEDELEALTLKIMDLEAAVNDPEVLRDHIRLREVCDELDDARFHETELEARWEALVEQPGTDGGGRRRVKGLLQAESKRKPAAGPTRLRAFCYSCALSVLAFCPCLAR